jgi:hypothetical protein
MLVFEMCLSGLSSLDTLIMSRHIGEQVTAANFHGLPTSLTRLTLGSINATTPITHISHLVSLRALKVTDDDTCDWRVALRNMTQLDLTCAGPTDEPVHQTHRAVRGRAGRPYGADEADTRLPVWSP